MAARLKDIAEACGLDVSTVSRALRGDSRIQEKTVARIKSAAQKMGYRANSSAQALVGAKTRVVWLVLSNMGNVLEHQIAEAASRYLESKGYDLAVVLCHGKADRYKYLLERLRDNPADGALVVPPFASQPRDAITALAQESVPMVFVDRYPKGPQLPVVTTANRAAARELVQALVDGGAEALVLLDDPRANLVQSERCAGYTDRAQELEVSHVYKDDPVPVQGSIGLLASSWPRAAEFVEKHRKLLAGRRVDAGVFDNWSGDRSQFASIVVCRQDFRRMAEAAVDMLIRQIERKPVPEPRIEVPHRDCEKVL